MADRSSLSKTRVIGLVMLFGATVLVVTALAIGNFLGAQMRLRAGIVRYGKVEFWLKDDRIDRIANSPEVFADPDPDFEMIFDGVAYRPGDIHPDDAERLVQGLDSNIRVRNDADFIAFESNSCDIVFQRGKETYAYSTVSDPRISVRFRGETFRVDDDAGSVAIKLGKPDSWRDFPRGP